MTAQNEALQNTVTTPMEEIDWESVVSNELPRLYNYFRYRLGDEAAAEDLTSAVLEKAWLKRHRYRKDRAAFSTWLFAIAKNEGIAYLRRRRPSPLLPANEKAAVDTEERILEHSQDLQQLCRVLMNLSEREQDLISLKYGAELNNREIAAIIGLTESNVGTILSRALHKLREQWEGAE